MYVFNSVQMACYICVQYVFNILQMALQLVKDNVLCLFSIF